MDGLTEGRQVHYVLPNGEHRSALVVRAWKSATAPDSVNLYVFLDFQNDRGNTPLYGIAVTQGETPGIWWCTSVHYSEGYEPGTWHWPERV